jgi:hypothetical protein
MKVLDGSGAAHRSHFGVAGGRERERQQRPLLLPPGGREKLISESLSAEDHLRFVRALDDSDLETY